MRKHRVVCDNCKLEEELIPVQNLYTSPTGWQIISDKELCPSCVDKLHPCRPHTGPMVFGIDWAGVFIRGDNAHAYADCLRETITQIASGPTPWSVIKALRELASLLESCDISMETEPYQVLKPYRECVVK